MSHHRACCCDQERCPEPVIPPVPAPEDGCCDPLLGGVVIVEIVERSHERLTNSSRTTTRENAAQNLPTPGVSGCGCSDRTELRTDDRRGSYNITGTVTRRITVFALSCDGTQYVAVDGRTQTSTYTRADTSRRQIGSGTISFDSCPPLEYAPFFDVNVPSNPVRFGEVLPTPGPAFGITGVFSRTTLGDCFRHTLSALTPPDCDAQASDRFASSGSRSIGSAACGGVAVSATADGSRSASLTQCTNELAAKRAAAGRAFGESVTTTFYQLGKGEVPGCVAGCDAPVPVSRVEESSTARRQASESSTVVTVRVAAPCSTRGDCPGEPVPQPDICVYPAGTPIGCGENVPGMVYIAADVVEAYDLAGRTVRLGGQSGVAEDPSRCVQIGTSPMLVAWDTPVRDDFDPRVSFANCVVCAHEYVILRTRAGEPGGVRRWWMHVDVWADLHEAKFGARLGDIVGTQWAVLDPDAAYGDGDEGTLPGTVCVEVEQYSDSTNPVYGPGGNPPPDTRPMAADDVLAVGCVAPLAVRWVPCSGQDEALEGLDTLRETIVATTAEGAALLGVTRRIGNDADEELDPACGTCWVAVQLAYSIGAPAMPGPAIERDDDYAGCTECLEDPTPAGCAPAIVAGAAAQAKPRGRVFLSDPATPNGAGSARRQTASRPLTAAELAERRDECFGDGSPGSACEFAEQRETGVVCTRCVACAGRGTPIEAWIGLPDRACPVGRWKAVALSVQRGFSDG